MKRIIDGSTYNTETATKIARWEGRDWKSDPDGEVRTLYLTRGGAFFEVAETGVGMEGRLKTVKFEPLTREEAHDWVCEGGGVEVFDDQALKMPPEAVGETPEATSAMLTVRLPASLRDRMANEAAARGQSMNAFALRCFERCLQGAPADTQR